MPELHILTSMDCVSIAHCALARARDPFTHTDTEGEVDTMHAFLAIGADVLGRALRSHYEQ